MTHPTTEPNIRERLARAALKGWANAVMKRDVAWAEDPGRWNAAVDAILAELDKISTERDLYVDEILAEIRDGGQ